MVEKDPDKSFQSILIQRSCKSGPTGPWYKWSKRPDTEILHKCPHNRGLVQVLLPDPDTSGPKDPHTEILKHRSCTSCPTGSKGSSYRDPERDLALVLLHTEILHKWSYRIPTQAVQRILIQRSCTSGPTRSWYKWSKMILIQRSWDRDLALVLLQDSDKWSKRIRILKQRSCTSGRTGSS